MNRTTPSTRTPRRSGVRALAVVVLVLAVGACSSGGDQTVKAKGEPAAEREPVTTTTREPVTTTEAAPVTTTEPPVTTTATAGAPVMQHSTTTTAGGGQQPQIDPCPPHEGEPVEYVVTFHEFPDDVKVGDEFACGKVIEVHPNNGEGGPEWIVVDVWDPGDFKRRTKQDPNVRYTDENHTGCAHSECD